MSGPWPARCPRPLGSWGPDALGELRGVGGRRGTWGSVILSSRAAQPSLGIFQWDQGSGRVAPEVPATAGPSRGCLRLQKTQPVHGLAHRARAGKTLPFMDGSPELREGQGLAQSHTASCGICMSLAAGSSYQAFKRIWPPPLPRAGFRGTGPPRVGEGGGPWLGAV